MQCEPRLHHYEVYPILVHAFPIESRERWRRKWQWLYQGAGEHATLPVVEDKGDLAIVVTGGAGPHSFFIPGSLNGRWVTVLVD